jgi:hypothetical protein
MSSSELLNAFADGLEAMSATLRRHAAVISSVQSDTAPRTNSPADVLARARAMYPGLGPRQAEVIELLADVHPESQTSRYLYDRMDGCDQPNVYNTCQRLKQIRLVENDPTARGLQYRLSPTLLVEE